MTAMERIKEIHEKKYWRGDEAFDDLVFYIKAYEVMREIAKNSYIREGEPYDGINALILIDKDFDERMKDSAPK